MSDRLREARDWVTLFLTMVTVLLLPIGILILKNQRLEILEQVRQQYVSQQAFVSDHNLLSADTARVAADNARVTANVVEINSKLDHIQITLARLMDATKLKDTGP